MTSIEEIYQARMDALSPKERVARSVAMFNWARDFIGREIRRDNPDFCEERLKLMVALRMYGSDPRMQKLLERELDRVPS